MLELKVNAFPGSDIRDTCARMVDLAKRLSVTVTCDFNGVHVMASPYSDPDRLVSEWERALRSESTYKIASDRGEAKGK